MALNSSVAVHSSAFAFDFVREETRERTDSPPDTIHRPIAKHQGGTPPCESSRGNLAMGLKLDAAGQQKEGFVIMGVNGMWKTLYMGWLLARGGDGWSFGCGGRKVYGEGGRMERDRLT
jgi:hypothetical protein